MSREPGDALGLEWKSAPETGLGSRVGGPERRQSRSATVRRSFSSRSTPVIVRQLSSGVVRNGQKWRLGSSMSGQHRCSRARSPVLIDLYLNNEYSPYHELRHRTQHSYDQHLRVLKTSVGTRRIDRLNGEDFRRWCCKLREPKSPELLPRVGRAHNCMTMLRIPFAYGQTTGLPNCERLKSILAEMRFKNTPPRLRTGRRIHRKSA